MIYEQYCITILLRNKQKIQRSFDDIIGGFYEKINSKNWRFF